MATRYAAIIPVWIGALVAGIITGVGIKAGIEPSQEGIALAVMEAVCSANEDMPNSAPQICWTLYGVIAVLAIVMFLISIVVAIASIGNWIVGAIVYACGFIPGILLILLS